MGRPRIYLASALGFSTTTNGLVLPAFVEKLESLGFEVYEPFAANTQNGLGPDGSDDWFLTVGEADKRAVIECDAIFAIVNGMPPDEGVAFELGVAAAFGKPSFLYRDDFRKAGEAVDVNLMLLTGLPKDWQSHYYTSLAELGDKEKGLCRYLESCRNPNAKL